MGGLERSEGVSRMHLPTTGGEESPKTKERRKSEADVRAQEATAGKMPKASTGKPKLTVDLDLIKPRKDIPTPTSVREGEHVQTPGSVRERQNIETPTSARYANVPFREDQRPGTPIPNAAGRRASAPNQEAAVNRSSTPIPQGKHASAELAKAKGKRPHTPIPKAGPQ